MENKLLKREVTIIFTEDEFSTLNLLATKLNISVPEVVRSLVPRFPPPQTLEDWRRQAMKESAKDIMQSGLKKSATS